MTRFMAAELKKVVKIVEDYKDTIFLSKNYNVCCRTKKYQKVG